MPPLPVVPRVPRSIVLVVGACAAAAVVTLAVGATGRAARVTTARAASAAPPAGSAPVTAASTGRVTLVGRLISNGAPIAHCGVIHMGTPMEWEVVTVEEGASPGPRVTALVGCAELPRRRYADGAGSLEAFRQGDLHRLVISADPADGRGLTRAGVLVVVSADPV